MFESISLWIPNSHSQFRLFRMRSEEVHEPNGDEKKRENKFLELNTLYRALAYNFRWPSRTHTHKNDFSFLDKWLSVHAIRAGGTKRKRNKRQITVIDGRDDRLKRDAREWKMIALANSSMNRLVTAIGSQMTDVCIMIFYMKHSKRRKKPLRCSWTRLVSCVLFFFLLSLRSHCALCHLADACRHSTSSSSPWIFDIFPFLF